LSDLNRRRLLVYAGVAVLVLALGGAGYAYLSYVAEHSRGPDGLPDHRAVRASDLWARPVAKLYYPGSKVVQTAQSDQSEDPNNPASGPARAETLLSTTADRATLEAWYRQALASNGFTSSSPEPTSAQPVDLEWRRGGREYFDLRIDSGASQYRVVYQVTR